MAVKRVSAEEALKLVQDAGYVYVDVRSVPEFESGHPEGAYNVPLLHAGPMGMQPNPGFLDAMEKAFPKDARLVLGCRSGGRSLQAAQLLVQVGYSDVVDQRAGFEGSGGPSGGGEAGWRACGLPVSTQALPERTWDTLRGD